MPRAKAPPPALAVVALVLMLGGCAGLKEPLPPAPSVPLAWAEPGAADAPAVSPEWWRGFGSEQLSALVAAAVNTSPDMAVAAERVRQAEAQVQLAGASLFPSLGISAGTGQRETRVPGSGWNSSGSSNVSLSASYEVDLWGRIASDVRASELSLRATRFDQETVRLSLVAGVASGYFQLLSLRGRTAVARDNLAIAERVQKVVDARVRYGANSALDQTRQQSAVLGQRASIVALELQERQTLYALAILTGAAPEGFQADGSDLVALNVPRVAAGLPSDLLLRRPDLASAEAQLAAANANVAVARAALLPGISLSGSAGLASNVLINVLNSPTAALALGASLAQPIFDGGRLRTQVDISRSRERELVENYRAAVLAALADVESALAATGRGSEQESLQDQVLVQARRALQLAEVRYREGADDLLSLLDAQRTLFSAQDQLAQIRLARLLAVVGLFKALGGGWSIPMQSASG